MTLTIEQFTAPGKYEIDLSFEMIKQVLKRQNKKEIEFNYNKIKPYETKYLQIKNK